MPVASFCASETAETERIASGREQGDHVSRRQGGENARGACCPEWGKLSERKVPKGFNLRIALTVFTANIKRIMKLME